MTATNSLANKQTAKNPVPSTKSYQDELSISEHVFLAMLSFLVFGVIPPVAYGYAFHETSDKDFTMVVVAVASFVCVGLLGIFKDYIDRCTGFGGQVKTIAYYLTTAVAISGVSYAAGDLAMRLIEKLGLFETGTGINMSLIPEVGSPNPSLTTY